VRAPEGDAHPEAGLAVGELQRGFMQGDDCRDQAEPQTMPAVGAAAIEAVEALGRPGALRRRNAGTIICCARAPAGGEFDPRWRLWINGG